MRLVLVLAFVLPTLAYLGVGVYLYRQEFADAKLRLAGEVRIIEEQALKLFETNEMLLERMLDLTKTQSDEQLLLRSAELHNELKRMAAALPQVQLLLIQGADSRAVANSRLFPQANPPIAGIFQKPTHAA